MEFFFYFIIFLFGTCIGSFLNCLIYRLSPVQHSVLDKSRSYCPKCKHQLNWQDLIPLFSFLVLKGKCRYCQKPISWQYPLVELSTGILFLFLSLHIFTGAVGNLCHFISLFFYWIISCFLIIIFVYDLKHYIIPDKIIYPPIILTFLYRLFGISNLGFVLDFKALANPLASAFLASVFFLLIVLISQEKWMGLGDVKLAFLMGLFLGFPEILLALFLAFFLGTLVGLILILLGKKTLKSKVPFAPFLITGTFLTFFLGDAIFDIIVL